METARKVDACAETARRPPSRSLRALAPFAAAFLLLAAIRTATLPPGPWEWDEYLFVEAARDGLDLRVNHPHPPGYPAFVLAAHSLVALGADPFHATTVVGAAGSLGAALAVAWLLTGLGLPRRFALFGALFYALIPAVWLHGVRPLTDGAGAAAVLLAAGALVRARGGRAPGWILAAGCLAAVAFGTRPQAAVALVPLALVRAAPLVRTRRGIAALATTAVAAVAITAALWAPVVSGSGGWKPFVARMAGQASYVEESDTLRPAELLEGAVWKRWWSDPFGNGGLLAAALVLSAVGLAEMPAAARLALLGLFLPLVAVTMPFSCLAAAPRYAAVLLPLPASLAAFGLARVSRVAGRWLAAAGGSALLGALALAGLPAVVEVATRPSPSAALAGALGADNRFRGRPVAADAPLLVPIEALAPGSARREIRPGVPMALGEGELAATADRQLPFLAPTLEFRYDEPSLSRISRGRYLSAALYADASGVGVVTARTEGAGAWASASRATLPRGSALELHAAAGPVRVEMDAATDSPRGGAALLTVGGSSREVALRPGSPVRLDVVASPDRRESLLRIAATTGTVLLGSIRLSAPPSTRTRVRDDPSLPVAVDGPAEGAVVRGDLGVRGWCQERGGGAVAPSEFRIDGVRLVPTALRRVPRPDVSAALASIGDASRAGFEAALSTAGLADGLHSLTVSFLTPDGRSRVAPPRSFTLRGPGGPRVKGAPVRRPEGVP